MAKTYKSEEVIQHECYIWFHNTFPKLRGLLFHVPNGGGRSALQGKIFKLTGVVPGVADLLFMYKGITYCIELKNKFGNQSEKQAKWQQTVEKQGFQYFIIRDLQTFKDLINSIINHDGSRTTI